MTCKCRNDSGKIERTLATIHSHMSSKSADYFKQLLESQNEQNKAFVSKLKVSETAEEASYLIEELIAQKRKSYTVGEIVIMPACKIMMGKMLHRMYYDKLKIFHLETV
jgi:hypothetical protein